jgi:type VI secretion system protein ImpM
VDRQSRIHGGRSGVLHPPFGFGVFAMPDAGWFGKMPALGDFASRRLPDDWIAAWDAWLGEELAAARDALGDEAWLALYLVAPIRRFWLAPGLLTRDAWLGVLMPSVDGVGRHFPFTLAAPLRPGHADLLDALANEDWLADADALARQVLDPTFDVAALEQAIGSLPAPHGERRGELHDGTLLARALHARHARLRCAWWCEGASTPDDVVGADGLPRGAAFMALWHGA